MRTRSSTLILIALLAVACLHCAGSHDPAAESHATEVAWFDGDPETAFARAKAENRPLFLYWGAEWCPPCHALKARIFHTPEFIAKVQEFIPVYLDGDTESAQILGEKLGAAGYPTVIIFDPDGREIMRMPSDVSVARYVELLDLALSRMRPVDEVLAQVLEVGPAKAEAADLNLLAFHSWGQDHTVNLEADERLETFRRLQEETPAGMPVEKSRFLAAYLDDVARAARRAERDDSVERVSIGAAERDELNRRVLEMLGDRDQRLANLPFIFYSCTETIETLHPDPSPERDALAGTWRDVAEAIEQDESLSVDDRLSAISVRLELAGLDAEEGAPLPESLVEHLRERVAWAGETVTDENELQAVMSSMVSLLEDAGLNEEAEALIEARMSDTHAPYYYMGWMASMQRDADRPEEALRWYRKAYDSARGRYSRFRWGSIYLRRLLDLAPADETTIRDDSLAILDELLTFDDAFSGGNFIRLEQLDQAYREWNAEGAHDGLITEFRDRVHGACERYPGVGEESQRSRCAEFLSVDS